jgi:hypothetical protein
MRGDALCCLFQTKARSPRLCLVGVRNDFASNIRESESGCCIALVDTPSEPV